MAQDKEHFYMFSEIPNDEEGKKKKLSEMTGKEKLAIVGQSMAETWG